MINNTVYTRAIVAQKRRVRRKWRWQGIIRRRLLAIPELSKEAKSELAAAIGCVGLMVLIGCIFALAI